MSNFPLPLPCFAGDTAKHAPPLSSGEKRGGVSYFIATTHDKGEKGEQPFLNEDNLPSAESRFSLKMGNIAVR